MADQARTRKHFVLNVQTAPLTGGPETTKALRSELQLATFQVALDPLVIANLAEEDPANTLMDLYIARTRWMN